MKYVKPIWLVILASGVVSLFFIIIFSIVSAFLNHSVDWLTLCVSALSVLIISFLLISFILKKFIYDKIKVIYKIIHTQKLKKEEKEVTEKRINLNQNILNDIDAETRKWAEQRADEIENLRKLETYRKDFLGNVSHELKTPIFNIQGYILTLLDGAMNDPNVNKDYLEKAEKNIERMINIVQDLEIISQLESGMMKLEHSKFDIVALTREIYEMVEMKAQQKNISLVFNETVTKDTQNFVWADKERIKQVLINLIENSIKYGNDGGRTKISYYDLAENTLIEVSDNGIGITQEHIQRLFERFYRVDKSRSRSMGGSGLGLAIVKHIIESHQQTVNVRSTPNVGSTFSFTLKKG